MRRALLTLTVIGLAAYLVRKSLDKAIDDATEGFGLEDWFPCFHDHLNTTEEQ